MKRFGTMPAAAALPLLLAALFVSGCATTRPAAWRGEGPAAAKIAALQRSLEGLGPGTDPAEARLIAETAVTHSRRLAEAYRMVPPARWHNLLIQVGLRERGLCFHWTEDLMKRLQALAPATYELHWGVAHRGSELREHNSVVITAVSQAFAEGLVLDPWRNSGDLFWVVVARDAYPWEPLPRAEW